MTKYTFMLNSFKLFFDFLKHLYDFNYEAKICIILVASHLKLVKGGEILGSVLKILQLFLFRASLFTFKNKNCHNISKCNIGHELQLFIK